LSSRCYGIRLESCVLIALAIAIPSLAAAYGYGIVKNHPFVDGNKRTSYVMMRTFLKLNGYDLQASNEEKYQIWLSLAAGQLSEEELAK
jgi:death-on-curing protein